MNKIIIIILNIFGFLTCVNNQKKAFVPIEKYYANDNGEVSESLRIMVLPITKISPNKKITVLTSPDAEKLRESLVANLKRSAHAIVVEHDKELRALKDIAFEQRGVIDKTSAIKIRKITDADKIISAIFSEDMLTFTLTDVSSMKIEYTQKIHISEENGKEFIERCSVGWSERPLKLNGAFKFLSEDVSDYIGNKILKKNIVKLNSIQSPFITMIKSSKQIYANNEPVSFEITIDSPTHLYLLAVYENGEIETIFPSDSMADNFREPGKFILPPDGFDFNFAGSKPFGKIAVKAIFSGKKLTLYHPGTEKAIIGYWSEEALCPWNRWGKPNDIRKGKAPIVTDYWNIAEISIERK